MTIEGSGTHATPASDANIDARIVAGIADAVIFADTDGVIRRWNEGATAVFGFAADDVLGESLDLIIPERLRAAHWKGFDSAIERGATSGGREARLTRGVHQDPERKLYVEMTFAVVTADDDSVLGSVAVARDVTDKHLAERAKRDDEQDRR